MDSVSQFVLGAAVGGALLGPKVGRKALLWGGVIATLPDLDVLVPLGDPVSNFTYHRSASHSLFVLTLVTPLLAWFMRRFHPAAQVSLKAWSWYVWLILVTHVLLDCFTIYGTQIFWPFWPDPVAWGTIFIVDPLYTVPLLIAVGIGLSLREKTQRIRRWSNLGLALSSLYLAFTVGAKLQVEQAVEDSLASRQIPYSRFMTVPTYFNTILWRTVVMTDEGYLEGFYSLLDGDPKIRFRHYPSHPDLLGEVHDSWAVQRLAWFTKGFYRVLEEDGWITMTDLRMGQEPDYVFSFRVAVRQDGQVLPITNERHPQRRPSPEVLSALWERILTGPELESCPAEGVPFVC